MSRVAIFIVQIACMVVPGGLACAGRACGGEATMGFRAHWPPSEHTMTNENLGRSYGQELV